MVKDRTNSGDFITTLPIKLIEKYKGEEFCVSPFSLDNDFYWVKMKDGKEFVIYSGMVEEDMSKRNLAIKGIDDRYKYEFVMKVLRMEIHEMFSEKMLEDQNSIMRPSEYILFDNGEGYGFWSFPYNLENCREITFEEFVTEFYDHGNNSNIRGLAVTGCDTAGKIKLVMKICYGGTEMRKLSEEDAENTLVDSHRRVNAGILKLPKYTVFDNDDAYNWCYMWTYPTYSYKGCEFMNYEEFLKRFIFKNLNSCSTCKFAEDMSPSTVFCYKKKETMNMSESCSEYKI